MKKISLILAVALATSLTLTNCSEKTQTQTPEQIAARQKEEAWNQKEKERKERKKELDEKGEKMHKAIKEFEADTTMGKNTRLLIKLREAQAGK